MLLILLLIPVKKEPLSIMTYDDKEIIPLVPTKILSIILDNSPQKVKTISYQIDSSLSRGQTPPATSILKDLQFLLIL
jgi:hypothetical protein